MLEVVGKAAASKTFSTIIYRTNYQYPGSNAQSSWASNTAPIPMFEVSALSSGWSSFGKVTEVNLTPTANRYSGIAWFDLNHHSNSLCDLPDNRWDSLYSKQKQNLENAYRSKELEGFPLKWTTEGPSTNVVLFAYSLHSSW
jgi:hypothetical protein